MLSEPEESKMLTEKKKMKAQRKKKLSHTHSLEELILLKCPYNPE